MPTSRSTGQHRIARPSLLGAMLILAMGPAVVPTLSLALPAPTAQPAAPGPAHLPAPTAVPNSEPVPEAAALPAAPAPPSRPPATEAWFGFGFRCGPCTVHRTAGETHWIWEFEDLPEVFSVDPGSPAERAGLQRADVLTHIDGIPLKSPEGGIRFGSVREGQEVRWTVQRGDRTLELDMVAGPPPGRAPEVESPAAPAAELPAERHLRYAGSLGGIDVEVRGAGPVVVRQEKTAGRIVIITGDVTVTLREAGPGQEQAADDDD